jgi:hypothetical protein
VRPKIASEIERHENVITKSPEGRYEYLPRDYIPECSGGKADKTQGE